MYREDIVCSLQNIFARHFGKAEAFREENFGRPLTECFSFTALDLAHLYILVQEAFDVSVKGKLLNRGQLNTINGIVDIVQNAMNKKDSA